MAESTCRFVREVVRTWQSIDPDLVFLISFPIYLLSGLNLRWKGFSFLDSD